MGIKRSKRLKDKVSNSNVRVIKYNDYKLWSFWIVIDKILIKNRRKKLNI